MFILFFSEPEIKSNSVPKLDLSIEYRVEKQAVKVPANVSHTAAKDTRHNPASSHAPQKLVDTRELVNDDSNVDIDVGKPIKISERPRWGVKVNAKVSLK